MCPRKNKGPSRIRLSPCFGWWSQSGSNRRPLQCHRSALPAELWPRTLMAAGGIIPSLRLGNRCWLAVASALVVLDLDFDLDTVLVVLEVGIRQRVIGLGITEIFALRGLEFLLGGGGLGGGGQHGGCSGGRGGCRLAAAADLHEVFAIMLTPALGAFDRSLVEVIKARCTVLAGALGAPGCLDQAGSPGNSAKSGLATREGARMSWAFHPVKTKFRHASAYPARLVTGGRDMRYDGALSQMESALSGSAVPAKLIARQVPRLE